MTAVTRDLDYYVGVLEEAIATTEPLSQRARVLTSLQRFAERAKRALDLRGQSGVPGFRMVATMLEVRDMVRAEQSWVDALVREEAFSREHQDLLDMYKMLLAVVESTTMVSVGYIGSDKEASAEAGWWAKRAGAVLMETLSIVPALMALPEDKR